MPLPFRHVAGELARAAEVNANFDYIMDIIGQLSTPGQIQPLGQIVLGPRRTATLSADQDTGATANEFVQLSWNATWTKEGASHVFGRRLSNLGGAAIRVGSRGFEVLATPNKTASMSSSMESILRADNDDDGRFVYIHSHARMSRVNAYPHNLEENALRTVLLDNPIAIYNSVAVSAGTTTFSAFDFGIHPSAQAIIIRAHVTAYGDSGAGMMFYRKAGGGQGNLVPALEQMRGFVVHAPITGSGVGMRAGGQGVVPLGRASENGRFSIHRTARFHTAVVHIVGYMI